MPTFYNHGVSTLEITPNSPSALTHLAAYAFAPLGERSEEPETREARDAHAAPDTADVPCTSESLEQLREQVLALAQKSDIKGTILLAHEGINLFICAPYLNAHQFMVDLKAMHPAFARLQVRETRTDAPAFKRLKVKIKSEIIRYGVPQATPLTDRAAPVAPDTLSRWIAQGHDDQGKALALLDTRNDFEVDAGTFKGALDWRIQRFTQFGEQAAAHLPELKDKTVVAFCTGGIRCEKAVLHMQQLGHPSVYQLDGGVLGYFEHVGRQHWDGELFVFDARRAVTDEHSIKSKE